MVPNTPQTFIVTMWELEAKETTTEVKNETCVCHGLNPELFSKHLSVYSTGILH